MKTIKVDLNRIREALPNRASVVLKKTKQPHASPYLEIKVEPSLSEEDFEMCKNWQREIIGKENISEFYTEETGHHWMIYLKRFAFEFEGVSDEDINSFTGTKLVKDGALAKKPTK